MKRLVSFLFLFFLVKVTLSQVYPQWTEHLPYKKAKQLVSMSDKIYCLTESGVFSYSLSDNEIVAYNRSSGLTGTQITAMGLADWAGCLVLGYQNGNIDLIKKGKVINIADVARFPDISDKMIRSVTAYDKKVYLGTDFGVVILNIDKNEVAETCYIGNYGAKIAVNDIAVFDNYIWAATEEGIYKASVTAFNLADYSSWQFVSDIENANLSCRQFKIKNNKFYLLRDRNNQGTVFQLQNKAWQKVYTVAEKVYRIAGYSDKLCVITNNRITDLSGAVVLGLNIPNCAFRDILQIEKRVFVADNNNSMLEAGNGVTSIRPDGPLSNVITAICSSESAIWAAAGVKKTIANPAELYQYSNNRWENFIAANTPQLEGKNNIIALVADKLDPQKLYASLWNQGVMVFDDKEFQTFFNADNTPVRINNITAMTTDRKGNLWLLNAKDNRPVKVFTTDNSWAELGYPNLPSGDFKKIIALSNGDKWILKKSDNRIFALNENGTIGNSDDDATGNFVVKDKDGDIIGNTIYDMVQDTDDEVWLATSGGVAVYVNPGAVLRKGSFFAYRPIITIDDVTQYLLSTETVLSIAVNGANQKWIGTANSGVYLISESGEKQLQHFTTENSPLPSNRVEQISINQKSGEVFFVTDKGMVSYRGKVTAGSENYNDLYVYPNPVRETYHGDITVTGLKSNSSIRITDVSGNLVAMGQSAGGQFLWNGKNLNGDRVHTGVYLIFCADSSGEEAKVIKLLVIH